MPRNFSRNLRVAAEIRRLLNELLQHEVKDPRLHGVRVTEVELSGDLGVAKIFFSPLQIDDDSEQVLAAFGKASGFFRGRVGKSLRLRRVPELRFAADSSARQGVELGRLLDETAAQAASDERLESDARNPDDD